MTRLSSFGVSNPKGHRAGHLHAGEGHELDPESWEKDGLGFRV